MISSWVKNALLSGKSDMQESGNKNLEFVLSTAPIWDRLATTCTQLFTCYVSLQFNLDAVNDALGRKYINPFLNYLMLA